MRLLEQVYADPKMHFQKYLKSPVIKYFKKCVFPSKEKN